MNLRSAALMLMLFALAPPALADEAFDKLKADYETAEKGWNLKGRELSDEDGRFDAGKMPPHPAGEFLPRLREMAESHAGAPEAVAVLNYMLRVVSRSILVDDADEAGEWALDQLQARHADNPAIAETLQQLRYISAIEPERLRAFYQTVIQENSDEEIVARAKFNLAANLHSAARRAARRSDGDSAEGGESAKPEESPDFKRAVALFREVVSKHAGTKAAQSAEGFLFELNHLQIGMKAPEITGTDAEGKETRLSQFAGQVVVLDFWGFW